MEKLYVGFEMANKWTDPPMVIMYLAFGGIPGMIYTTYKFACWFGIYGLPVPALALVAWYFLVWHAPEPNASTAMDNGEHKYLIFKDEGLKSKYNANKIPIGHLYEYYIDGAILFKYDVLITLDQHRDEFVNYKFSADIFKFLISQFLGPLSSSFKDMLATEKEIAAHYDRGNDFFAAFLGPAMVYTSGVYYNKPSWTEDKDPTKPAKQTGGDSLETAQCNKMSLICDRLQLKPGDEYMDIGCGWGTLMRHAAREYKVKSTGVTLSKEGAIWCNQNIEKEGIGKDAKILRMDYRDIPKDRRFKAISAIEMAEHVGIANFQLFLGNIYNNLEDDGMFLMQVAGLRKGSNWQDTHWGIFMSKYIFPGADASTPLNWYVKQCEKAGFEVQRVENIGRHYSHTLHGWYDHWMDKKTEVLKKPEYDGHEKHENAKGATPGALGRLWDFFLAWSVIASGQCSATCYQLTMHKNIYDFPRDIFCHEATVGVHNGKRGDVVVPNKNKKGR